MSFSSLAYAENSPVGLWKTIDDDTGKPRSLIRISDKNGELIATFEKGLFQATRQMTCANNAQPSAKANHSSAW